jgi:hypothetical protein
VTRVRRVLLELEQEDGKVFEVEIKDPDPKRSRAEILIAHVNPPLWIEDGDGFLVNDVPGTPHSISVSLLVSKVGDPETRELYTIRPVMGS